MRGRKEQHRRWRQEMGCSLADAQHARWAVAAALEGWYGVRSLAELETLRLLRERGPLTCHQLAEARGTAWGVMGSQGRLLARLRRAGLVTREARCHQRYLWREAR